MSLRPDSRWTQFRRRLAKRIEPGPPMGEAWCIGCPLNDGRTLIFPYEGATDHLERHHAEMPSQIVQIQARGLLRRAEQ